MLNDMKMTSEGLRHKQASLVSYAFVILAAIIGLALAYAVIMPNALAKVRPFSSLSLPGEHQKEASKQKILDWMAVNSSMPDNVLSEIYDAAALTGNIAGNRDLILAICLVESNFNPQAESHRGAIGLMGIMPNVWVKELKDQGIIQEKEDLYKISGNIAAGAHVLETYLSETNDLRQALIRYVGGASRYATRVLQAQKQIRLAQHADKQLAFSVAQN
jgi:soluble lytic murein transglycosylase-like protein